MSSGTFVTLRFTKAPHARRSVIDFNMWTTIGIIIELLMLAGVIAAFTVSSLLGWVMFSVWFFAGVGMFGILFSELDKEDDPKEDPIQEAVNPLKELLKKSGVSISSLRPSGSIEINGKRYEARSSCELVEPGTPIMVTDIQNGVLIVDKI